MKGLLRLAVTIAVALALLPWTGTSHADDTSVLDEYVPGELLVKFKSGANVAQKSSLAGVRMRAEVRRFEHSGVERWKLPEGVDMATAMAELRASPEVEFVEPNYRRRLYALRAMGCEGQWALDDMNVSSLPPISPAVTVAVIDTGVEVAEPHPELAGALIRLEKDPRGDEWPRPRQEPEQREEMWWHGTAVAAAIAGNGVDGVTGVARGVRLLPLYSDLTIASLLNLYDLLVALNSNDDPDDDVHILNASWGGPQFSMAESEGIARLGEAGILVVAAAGNSRTDTDVVADYPSSLPLPHIVAVAANAEGTGKLTAWSHFGAASVDLAAPGEDIRVAMPPTGYGCASGTSFSAPHVSGLAARIASALKQEGKAIDYREIKGRLIAGVRPVPAEDRGFLASGGRADAQAALSVSPRPLFVYAGHAIHNPEGNDNGVLEPGESAYLQISLENLWERADEATVRLISDDPSLEVLAPENNLDGSVLEPQKVSFPVQLSADVNGHRRIPLTLEIQADGHKDSRHFHLEIGVLREGLPATALIQQYDQDGFQVWNFYLPRNAARLEFRLAGQQGDLDLYATRHGVMEFDRCERESTHNMHASTGPGSNKTIVFEEALAGTYHVAVVNWYDCDAGVSPPYNVEYTLVAHVVPQKGSDGGGGEGSGLLVVATAGLLLLGCRRRFMPLLAWAALSLALSGCLGTGQTMAKTSAEDSALELIVTVDPAVELAAIERQLREQGAEIVQVFTRLHMLHVRAPAGWDLAAARERFGTTPGVLAVEPNVSRRLH